MAIFFTKQTVEETVDRELYDAQHRLQQQVAAHPRLQAAWKHHAETCTASKEGLVLVEIKEDEKSIGNLYGKSDVTVACSCKQIMYTFDEKGNLKIPVAKQNAGTTGYANTVTSPSSLYQGNPK